MAQITRKQQQQLAKMLGLPHHASIDDIVSAQNQGDSPNSSVVQRQTQLIREESFSGPLPSPEILDKYGKIVPDLPQRITLMAEREQGHRHEIESLIVRAQIDDAGARRREVSRGQWFGFILASVGMIAGTYLLAKGATAEGLTAFFSGIAMIAGAFVYKALAERKKKEAKQPATSSPQTKQ